MTDRFARIAICYEQLFPARPAQIDALLAARPAAAPELFVDLGCGSGTQLEAIHDRGIEVFGLDLSTAMILRLRERRPDLAPRVVCGDMMICDRLLGERMPGPAGLVYSIGNTLALLPDREALVATLAALRRLLHPAGAAFFQVVNFDRVRERDLRSFPPLERTGPAGERLVLERSFEPLGDDYLRFGTRLVVNDELIEDRESRLLALRRDRLEAVMAEAGFAELDWRGDYDDRPWSLDAPATILRAFPTGRS